MSMAGQVLKASHRHHTAIIRPLRPSAAISNSMLDAAHGSKHPPEARTHRWRL